MSHKHLANAVPIFGLLPLVLVMWTVHLISPKALWHPKYPYKRVDFFTFVAPHEP